MRQSDWFKDRDESEVADLAERIYTSLKWFFSDKNAECNRAYLGKMGNRIAYINAYVDHAEGKYMVWDPVTNFRTGCSFWGFIRKEEWPKSMAWCEQKAREILHLNEEE